MRIRCTSRVLLAFLILGLTFSAACTAGTDTAHQSDELSWERLQATYQYDASAPLHATIQPLQQTAYHTAEAIDFTAHDGARIPAVLYLPLKDETEPVPCILVLHGYGGDKGSYAVGLAPFVIPMGVAVMAIDARMHGERPRADQKMFSTDLQRTHDAMVNTVIDNRRALDYLDTREEIDQSRYMCMGMSMGAILGSVLGAVDERIGSAALIVGGGDLGTLVTESALSDVRRMREKGVTRQMLEDYLADVEPTNFIGHFSPRPLLMINGRQDEVVIPECATSLHQAANQPKKIVWYDGGHIPPPTVLFASLEPFIEQQFIEQGE